MAARSAEGRVRERTVKARERLRRNARDRKFEVAELPAGGDTPASKGGDQAKDPETKKLEQAKDDSAESAVVKEGAQGIADRLKCLKDRPNAAEKRAALIRVLTGGRENYFTFEPRDVLLDLKEHSVL